MQSGAPIPQGLRVLVVDDEAMIRTLVRRVLGAEGCQVEEASSGDEALAAFEAALARGEPFQLVVTDLGIEGPNGRELAARIRGTVPDLFVVLLTGRSDDDAPSDGVDRVHHKPCGPTEIRALLAAARAHRGA